MGPRISRWTAARVEPSGNHACSYATRNAGVRPTQVGPRGSSHAGHDTANACTTVGLHLTPGQSGDFSGASFLQYWYATLPGPSPAGLSWPPPLPPMRQHALSKRFVKFGSFTIIRKRARGEVSPRARAFSFRNRIVRTGVSHPRSDDSRAFLFRVCFCTKT